MSLHRSGRVGPGAQRQAGVGVRGHVSGRRVGEGDRRSPVVLIGTGDANNQIVYERAGGPDPDYAQPAVALRSRRRGTGLDPRRHQHGDPSDLLRVDDRCICTRSSTAASHRHLDRDLEVHDSGISWRTWGSGRSSPLTLHRGYAQCWSWDYDPDDEWVYVVSTGFQRDKGIILRRVRPGDIGDMSKYSGWGCAGRQWGWGNEPTPITPVRRDLG